VVSTVGLAPGTAGWILKLAADGAVVWQKSYNDALDWIDTTGDGGLLIAGASDGGALAAKLDSAGTILWQKIFPQFSDASRAFELADGGFVVAGLSFLVRLEKDLALAGLCAGDGHLVGSITTAAAMDVVLAPQPLFVDDGGPADTGNAPRLASRNVCGGCAVAPQAIQRLAGVRRDSDADFSWDADPGANGYDLWYVTDKVDIDRARLSSSPPAVPVAGCAPPASAGGPACADLLAVPRAGNLFHYQVRAFCTAGAEGP
jgi:hypothetical protein